MELPGVQISSFLGEAVERSHISGLCQNLRIQSLILEPVFPPPTGSHLLLPAVAEEEEEVTHMHWGSIQLTD